MRDEFKDIFMNIFSRLGDDEDEGQIHVRAGMGRWADLLLILQFSESR